MTADEYLKAVKKCKLKVSPVLDPNGKISSWQAGKMSVIKATGMNLVASTDFAHGLTPEEAVEKLLAGRTLFLRKNGGLIENPKERLK